MLNNFNTWMQQLAFSRVRVDIMFMWIQRAYVGDIVIFSKCGLYCWDDERGKEFAHGVCNGAIMWACGVVVGTWEWHMKSICPT